MGLKVMSPYEKKTFFSTTASMSRWLMSGQAQGDYGGATGLFELLDSSEDWERIGQRLDRQFVLMI